ncbi:hypothetical protein CBER1_04329 [Cercospora berteroae]|uniref:Uncharacterized protein n=1 Tax=Cercospora berteroae TaxID=357750 RepID=A0A2S6CJC5_9PEZI|nr:hypothetical protein CBER1_04329 [Cercospora berteroae]
MLASTFNTFWNMVTYSVPGDSPPSTPVRQKRGPALRTVHGPETPSSSLSLFEHVDSSDSGIDVMPMSEVKKFVASQSIDPKRLSAIPEELNGSSDPNYVPEETIPGVSKYTEEGKKRSQVTDQYEDVFQDSNAPALVDGLYRLQAPGPGLRDRGDVPRGTSSSSPKSHDPRRTLEEAADANGEPGLRGVTAARREGPMMARYVTSRTVQEWVDGGNRPGSQEPSKRRRLQ